MALRQRVIWVFAVILLGIVFKLLITERPDNTIHHSTSEQAPQQTRAALAQTLPQSMGAVNRQTTALAEPQQVDAPAIVQLWPDLSSVPETEVDGVSGWRFTVETDALDKFAVDQLVIMPLPHSREPVSATIQSTHNQQPGVEVWLAEVLSGLHHDNAVVVKGPLETHITLYTQKNTYSVVIDNRTGAATLIDEREWIDQAAPCDSGIAVPTFDDSLPNI